MLVSIIGPVEIEYILDLLLAMTLGFAVGASLADVSGRRFASLQSYFTLSCDTSMIMRADK
jgi:hypothetical protein